MNSGKKFRAVVAGATGYSGRDLIKLLLAHPQIELAGVFASPASAETPLAEIHPQLTGMTHLVCRGYDEARLRAIEPDVVFLATPNEFSHEVVPSILAFAQIVIDVSGAYRLRDVSLYPKYYGFEHTHPDLVAQAVYGLTEFAREELKGARLIANPGCYPTSLLIPVRPLLDAGVLLEEQTIICDSKSGVTGAGKAPNSITHFSEVTESLRAYNLFAHRHAPEMAQGLDLPNRASHLVFTPHLLPINRGILSTIYVELNRGVRREDVLAVWRERFSTSPFVRIFGDEQLPEIKFVANTPFVDIGLEVDPDSGRAIIVSAIDNLLKGAASQALQNANLALGLDERAGMTASFQA
ncbi:MAG: N-acetyl-gamma-glutamyl-phosphate reductase [Acidobacteriota bacterium]